MKITRIILITVVLAVMCCLSYAQTNQPDYKNPPKPKEKVLGFITTNIGYREHLSGTGKEAYLYAKLLEKAQNEYPNRMVEIREMQYENTGGRVDANNPDNTVMYYKCTGKVVYSLNAQIVESLSAAVDKAFRNVREGSRTSIDQITVTSGLNREEIKDQFIDILLDKGYKVVAKEYLEKLYEEQQQQQSGIYNDKTTVQDNNFSAVGYFVNVKITETSVRVQVVNVSTGECEGNATLNF